MIYYLPIDNTEHVSNIPLNLMTDKEAARQLYLSTMEGISSGRLNSFAPLVSLFHIRDNPMTLDKHYQLLPMYGIKYSEKMVFMVARQLGKTTNLCSSSQIRSSCLPHYHTIMVEPRFEQIQRMNNTIYVPMLKSYVLKEDFISNVESERLALKKFKNGSMTIMGNMYTSPDKLRGVSGACLCVLDELQDLNYEYIPIIAETMSASELWATMLMAGTPLTTDTTLGLIWDQSSQAEWAIKCTSCNQYNIPNPVHDLEHMIGKHGCICAKCGKSVNPINGCYVHAIPSRQFTFPGYHVSQTIHPLHCMNPRKWMDLLSKINSYSQQKLYNEVFGWPYDISVMPLTRKDVLESRNKHKHADYTDIHDSDLSPYRYISVGIDFDGGGALSMSYTNLAVCGLRKDSNAIDCIFCKRYPKGRRVKEVADHIMSVVNRVHPSVVAYDAGGAGFVYRQILADAGLEETFTMPFKYSSPSSGDVIKFHKGNRDDNSYYYSIDKSRSLAVIIEAVKGAAVTNPWFEETDPDPVPMELLSLVEQPKETPSGGIIYLIGRKSSAPDDYAHALNFACSAIWDHFRNYPKLGIRYDIKSEDDENEGTHKIEGDLWGDPDDWSEFRDSMNGPVFTEGGF